MTGDRVWLCAAQDVKPGEARRFDIGRHRVALVRIGDDFYVLGDRCSHANYSLAEGEVLAEDREIECWKHGSTFSLQTGEPQSLPATRAVPVYDVERLGDDIWVVLPEADGEDGP